MKLKLGIVLILAIGVGVAMALPFNEDYYEHHEPSYWQEFKNALSDMNPFGGRLGHDWRDTQYRVEDIYRESQLDAQRKVSELREENLKDAKDLQKKIADIYLSAAADAEKRIEKLKHPLIASLWYGRRGAASSSYEDWYPTATHEKARHYYEKGKEAVGDAADKVKKKLSPGDEVGMFDEASKKIRDTYYSAMDKAKEGLTASPSMKETWEDAKRRVSRTYDDVFKTSHGEARNILEKLRDGLDRGAHRVGHMASSAVYKTWHLLLHGLLAGFWLLLGGLAYSGIKMYLDRRTFNKQLAAPLQGPVILSKIFHVYGTEDTQKKFQDYWTNVAQGFFTKQPGLRKFSLIRGVNVGSNCWCHMSEWNSIEDLRKAVAQPEIAELKKRMPKSFYSKRCISQIVSTGKGGQHPSESGRGEGDVRSEGLRQRGGPGTTQTTS